MRVRRRLRLVLVLVLLFAPSRHASAQADFNGDGRADIVFRNWRTGHNLVWLMNPGGVIGGAYALPQVPDPAWRLMGVSDVNADGKPDLVWFHVRVMSSVTWLMDGPTIVGAGGYGCGSCLAIGDFDGDGYPDSVGRNPLVAPGLAIFSGVGPLFLPDVTDHTWTLEQAADFNGDGRADLVWFHRPSGQWLAWFLGPSVPGAVQSIVGSAPLPTLGTGGSILVQAADFDGNGSTDLLWRDPASGALRLQYLSGLAVLSTVTLPTPSPDWRPVGPSTGRSSARNINDDLSADDVVRDVRDGTVSVLGGPVLGTMADLDWQMALMADFNSDGQADLVWRHRVSGQNQVWYLSKYGVTSVGTLPAAPAGWRLAQAVELSLDGTMRLTWRLPDLTQVAWDVRSGVILSTIGPFALAPGWDFVAPGLIVNPLGQVVPGDPLCAAVGGPGYDVVQYADKDGDGFQDLVLRQQSTGDLLNFFYRIRSNGCRLNFSGPVLEDITITPNPGSWFEFAP